MPYVAAVVLSHNDAGTIAEAVESIVRQPRSEELASLVVADDASSDASLQSAQAAAGRFNVTLLQTAHNLGQWRNLNRTFTHLSGHADWVLLLHADDVAADGWLEAMLDRIGECAENVASICCSWNPIVNGRVIPEGEVATDAVRIIAGGHEAVRDTLLHGCWWKISGAAIRTRALSDIGGFDPDMPHNGDWEWLLRALARGWSFEYLPRPYVLYRQHASSVSARSLRGDIDIAEALIIADRFGSALSRPDLIRFHGARAYYVLRRTARGVLRRDPSRVAISMRSLQTIARHLITQLAG